MALSTSTIIRTCDITLVHETQDVKAIQVNLGSRGSWILLVSIHTCSQTHLFKSLVPWVLQYGLPCSLQINESFVISTINLYLNKTFLSELIFLGHVELKVLKEWSKCAKSQSKTTLDISHFYTTSHSYIYHIQPNQHISLQKFVTPQCKRQSFKCSSMNLNDLLLPISYKVWLLTVTLNHNLQIKVTSITWIQNQGLRWSHCTELYQCCCLWCSMNEQNRRCYLGYHSC